MYTVYLSLGSNKGDREKNIKKAYKKIEEQIGEIISSSEFFYSLAVGFISDNNFVNSVCEVMTTMKPWSLLLTTQSIEKEIGRTKKSTNKRFTDRVIDIDIIMVDNMIIDTHELIIPHPRFHERDFVLSPLCEIAPYIIHPVLQKSIEELKNELDRKSFIL